MSYCRWSEDSDVYVIYSVDDQWECVGCSLSGHTVALDSPLEMALHLSLHHAAGQNVWRPAIARLMEEQRALDAGWPREQLWRMPDGAFPRTVRVPGLDNPAGVARGLVFTALIYLVLGLVIFLLVTRVV